MFLNESTSEAELREEQASIERLRLVDGLTRAEAARLEAIRRELARMQKERRERTGK